MVLPGPDVASTCGRRLYLLQIGTEYLAGIGHACSVLSSWDRLSSYSSQELDFLQLLNITEECNGTPALLHSFTFFALSLAVAVFCNT